MTFPIFTSIYRSPDASGSGAAAPTAPSPTGGDGGAGPQGGQPAAGGTPAPRFTLSKTPGGATPPAGGTPNGQAGAGDTPDYLKPDGKGRLFGGRFDEGEHSLTPEVVSGNPAVRKIVEAYHNLEVEHSNRPSPHKAAVTKEQLAALDLLESVETVDGSIRFNSKAVEALKGKFIPGEIFAEIAAPMLGQMRQLMDVQREAYMAEATRRMQGNGLPCTAQEVIDWVQSPDSPFDAARVKSIGEQLSDPEFRDAIMDTLAAKFIAHQEANQGFGRQINESERLKTPSGPGVGSSGGDVYQTYAEAESAFIAAGNDPKKLAEHDAKLRRSPQAYLRPGAGMAV